MTNGTHEDEEYTIAQAADLPDPTSFNRHMLYRYGRAFQRRQDADGHWYWAEIDPPPMREKPSRQ